MNKNKGFIGIGLILAIVFGIVVVGGGAYYLGKSINKVEKSQPQETKNLNTDLYPLYQNLSWGSEVFSSFDTYGSKLSGFKIVSKGILDGEYYKLDTSFEKYYDTKLTSLGWVRDHKFQADGAGSSSWSYIKGDERIIFYYNSTAINQKPNEPLSCPCDMIFEIFSGKENIDKTKTISTTDWKTYTNTKYGFELKYPNDWVFSTFPNPDGFFFNNKSQDKFTFAILPRGGFDHGYEEEPVLSDVQINGKQVKESSWNNSVVYQFIGNTIPSTWVRCGLDLKNCNRIEIQGSDQLELGLIDQILLTFKFIN